MNPALLAALRNHLELCQEILLSTETEAQTLRQPAAPDLSHLYRRKKDLLPKLVHSLDQLRRLRAVKGTQTLESDASQVDHLVRQNQDTIMKIAIRDRENELILLRRGLIPAPALAALRWRRAPDALRAFSQSGRTQA